MDKLCRYCGKVKPLEEFGSDAHQFDGRSCYCKECLKHRRILYNNYKKQGRIATLARFSDEELMYELEYRRLQSTTTM